MVADRDTAHKDAGWHFRRLWSSLPLARFGSVGALNTLLYSLISAGLIALAMHPTLASALAYAACLPLAFWSHKRITFRSGADAREELPKFLAVQGLSFGIAVGLMHGVATFGYHHAVAIAITVVVVPLVSFVVMDRWVFARSLRRLRETGRS